MLTPAQYSAPQNAANAASNSAHSGPMVNAAREITDSKTSVELVVQFARLRTQIHERHVQCLDWPRYPPRGPSRETAPTLGYNDSRLARQLARSDDSLRTR